MYINERSRQLIDASLENFPQSSLLHGPKGVGLHDVAEYIGASLGAEVLFFYPEKDNKIHTDKGSITVDSIREIQNIASLSVHKRRLIVIEQADKMTKSAQNALLKLLEEPNSGIYIILLSHQPSLLLPTIRSRVSRYEIDKITPQQSEQLLDELSVTDTTKRAQLLFIASGLPQELTSLATDQDYFEKHSAYIRDARSFIQSNNYEKLKIIDKYKDDRLRAISLLTSSAKLLAANLSRQDSLIKDLTATLHAVDRIEANGNVRIWLMTLVV